MLNISLQELREKEFNNVERNGWDIANRIRVNVSDESSAIICAAFVAYLAKRKSIDSVVELTSYLEKDLAEEQYLFVNDILKDCLTDVMEIANNYSEEALAAVILWQTTTGRFGDGYGTPDSIVKLAMKILNPMNGEKVADICSGSGCFLTEVAASDIGCSLYGVEINTYSKEISAIRLGLISDMVEIQQGSAFGLPADKKFNKIFCDYPWNSRTKNAWIEKESLKNLEEKFPDLKRSTIADWHFIINAVNHLEEGGKAVVVTTNATVWNGGVSRVIREQILKAGYIEAVIALPANLYPMTSIPTTLLVLSKDNRKVRMIDASSMATVGRRQNVLDEDAIVQICRLLGEDANNSLLASMDKIAENDFTINPNRFLETEVIVEDGVPFDTVIKNITRGAQIKASDLDELVSDVQTDYQYLMLANIQDGMINDNLPYLKEIDKKNEKYCIKNNSLVISKNGAPVKIAVASVEDGKKILANGNLYVIELDEAKVNPYFIKTYLDSENGTVALSRITVGAVLPNIPVDSLKKLLIPLPSMEKQRKLAERYQAKLDELKVLKYRISKVTNELRTIYEEE